MPKIVDRCEGGSEARGALIFNDGSSQRKKRAPCPQNSYHASFHWPSNDRELATCVLVFVYEVPRAILLVGQLDGLGCYKWKGICPHTMQPHQILSYDSGTQLFVSRRALGKPAPASVRRKEDHEKVLEKAIAKHGKFDVLKPKTYPCIQKDADFTPLKSLEDIFLTDTVFAASGYPFAVRDKRNKIDVLATILDPRSRQRLPYSLLAKSKHPLPPRNFKNFEEMHEAMRARNMPIGPEHHTMLLRPVSKIRD